jgi:hypothetical protein
MKKIFCILLSLMVLGTASFAQKKETKAKQESKTEKAITKDDKAAPSRKMKKDGTPDMRYKENKDAAKAEQKPAGKMKKDGTADMRYKENKEAAKKK